MDLRAFTVQDDQGVSLDVPALPALASNDVKAWREHLQTVLNDDRTSINGVHPKKVQDLNQAAAQFLLDQEDQADRVALRQALQTVLRLSVNVSGARTMTRMISPALQEALVGWLIARGASVDDPTVIMAVTCPNDRVLHRVLVAAQATHEGPSTSVVVPSIGRGAIDRVASTARRWLNLGAKGAMLASSSFARPNSKPKAVSTPIHKLAECQRWDSAQRSLNLLKAAGWALDVPNEWGQTPLLVAVKTRNLRVATALLKEGVNPQTCSKGSESPLGRAVIDNLGPLVKALLIAGADPWEPFDVSEGRHSNVHPTHSVQAAVEVGAPDALAALLAHGVAVLPPIDPQDPTSPLDERWLNVARKKAQYDNALPTRQACVTLLERVVERHVLTQMVNDLPVTPTTRARPRL